MKKISFILMSLFIFFVSCNKEENEIGVVPEKIENKEISLYAQKYSGVETKGVALKENLWDVGQTIKIKFFDGVSVEDREKIKQYSMEWLEYANLNFEYVGDNEKADIRIAMKYKGDLKTWSYIGTDASNIPQKFPTINLGKIGRGDKKLRAAVLMQFGHVLGMVNEHQRHDNPIVLDVDEVYDYYTDYIEDDEGIDAWTVKEINEFFFKPYSSDVTNHTDEYDPNSIMVWPIDNTLTIGINGVKGNIDLSELDKKFVAKLYPPQIMSIDIPKIATVNFTTKLNSEIIVNWGDGSFEKVDATSTKITHNYTKDTSVFHVKLYGSRDYSISELSLGEISNIDLTECRSLMKLAIFSSNLTGLDVSKSYQLRELVLVNAVRTGRLEISRTTSLERIICNNNNIFELEVSHNSRLVSLNCQFNGINRLILNNPSHLQELLCMNNNIHYMPNISNISLMNCSGNPMYEFMTLPPSLRTFICLGSSIKEIRTTGYVYIEGNRVERLILTTSNVNMARMPNLKTIILEGPMATIDNLTRTVYELPYRNQVDNCMVVVRFSQPLPQNIIDICKSKGWNIIRS